MNEVKQFKSVYRDAVLSLMDGYDINNMPRGTEREIKDIALQEAFGKCRNAKIQYDAYIAYMKRVGGMMSKGVSRPAMNAIERSGNSIATAMGGVWCEVKKGSCPGGNSKRSGLCGLYQQIAIICDLIPPDQIIAILTEKTVDGVATARGAAKKDGFEFESVSIKTLDSSLWQSSSHTWWVVKNRPSVAELSDKQLVDKIKKMSKDDLIKLLLANIKD